MRSPRLAAYRQPDEESLEMIQAATSVLIDGGAFRYGNTLPHLTLLRNTGRNRATISPLAQLKALRNHIESEPTEYTLPVTGIKSVTRRVNGRIALAIILDDPDGMYRQEYSSIRKSLPRNLTNGSTVNTPHITLATINPELATRRLLSSAEDLLPQAIHFDKLQFSRAVLRSYAISDEAHYYLQKANEAQPVPKELPKLPNIPVVFPMPDHLRQPTHAGLLASMRRRKP